MSDRSKRKILNRLKNTVTREEHSASSSGSIFLNKNDIPLPKLFEEQLIKVNGTYIPCKNEMEFASKIETFLQKRKLSNISCMESNIEHLLPNTFQWTKQLNKQTEMAITGCEYLVAQTGSAVVSTQQTKSRRTFAYPSIHAIVAFKYQLVADLKKALNLLEEKYKSDLPAQITTITGPSRTADIEKTLVLGAHGPKELIIFYIDVETE